jgi:cytochrome c-type biogenesis protein CcmH
VTPILFALLALAVALVVAAPLVRHGPPLRSRAEYERAVYRDQVRELEEDAERGVLTAEQHQAARTEVDRRLLASARTVPAKAQQGRLPLRAVAVLLAIAIPAASVSLYLWQGSPAIPGAPLAGRSEIGRPGLSSALMEFIAEQQTEVGSDPANAVAWALLGRGYLLAGRYDEAVDSFGTAIKLGANGPEEQMGLAESLMQRAGGLVSPEAQQAIDAALTVDSANAAARFYQGEAHAQAGRTQAAFDIWLALAADTSGDAPWLEPLRARLEAASAELGIDLAAVLPETLPALPEGVADLSPEERMAMIEGMVAKLAARLAEEPDDFDGWARLAQSYRVLGRLDEAAQAAAAAAALRPNDPGALLQQAAILLEGTAPGDPFPEIAALNLGRVLAAEPLNAKALFLAAMVSKDRGDTSAARAHWERLLTLLDPGSEVFQEIESRIEALPSE